MRSAYAVLSHKLLRLHQCALAGLAGAIDEHNGRVGQRLAQRFGEVTRNYGGIINQ